MSLRTQQRIVDVKVLLGKNAVYKVSTILPQDLWNRLAFQFLVSSFSDIVFNCSIPTSLSLLQLTTELLPFYKSTKPGRYNHMKQTTKWHVAPLIPQHVSVSDTNKSTQKTDCSEFISHWLLLQNNKEPTSTKQTNEHDTLPLANRWKIDILHGIEHHPNGRCSLSSPRMWL